MVLNSSASAGSASSSTRMRASLATLAAVSRSIDMSHSSCPVALAFSARAIWVQDGCRPGTPFILAEALLQSRQIAHRETTHEYHLARTQLFPDRDRRTGAAHRPLA